MVKALGFAVLFLGWVVALVAVFDLVYEWLRAWFDPDPEREEWMMRVYGGALRRVR